MLSCFPEGRERWWFYWTMGQLLVNCPSWLSLVIWSAPPPQGFWDQRVHLFHLQNPLEGQEQALGVCSLFSHFYLSISCIFPCCKTWKTVLSLGFVKGCFGSTFDIQQLRPTFLLWYGYHVSLNTFYWPFDSPVSQSKLLRNFQENIKVSG